ncbi:hypothetical protein K8F61_15310 [Microbacterium resistens]|uniref:Uncharacterized protein n=1 Tax=Microbacterium resistens TaxID=156977 RepID=A0ABY3RPQ3_9MICO|nr:hypothetical protein K8F61_15310 [Microbacterium resistens]
MQASPWQTTSRSTAGGVRSASGTTSPRAAAFAMRAGTVHSQGHSATGSASCIVRSASPTARTAVSGSSAQRGSTALSPSTAVVTSHSCVSSSPCARTRGTRIHDPAQRIRSASSRMEDSALRGPHLT